MQKFKNVLLLLIFVVCGNVYAQTDSLEVKKIIMIDDSEFIGTIIDETSEIIFFKTRVGVEMEIKKSLIKEIKSAELEIKRSKNNGYRPGDHELLLMPTANTMDAGQSYFSDYELFLINFSYAATNRTHIGIFTLFPISSDFLETTTLGIKQNYYRSDKFNSAVWATYTPKISGLTIGNVLSYGLSSNSFHVGLSGMTGLDDESDEWEMVYMLGYRADVSRKACLIFEYTNFSTLAERKFNGLISVGFRFIGESIAWELGGIRPLEDAGDFIFWPLLKATVLLD